MKNLRGIIVGSAVLIILLLTGNTVAAPVEQWNKTFGGASYDRTLALQQTSDGYILAGPTSSYMVGSVVDAWLVKADANGNEVWNRSFGGVGADIARSVLAIPDGYVITGYTESFGRGRDAWLIKTDMNGIELWNRTLGGIRDDDAYSVQKTSDGYILAGLTYSYGTGGDFWLIKTDTNGNEIWNRTFGGTGLDVSYSMTTIDGGYILAGSNGYYDAWLVKTDASGNELWNRTFGRGSENALSVQQTSDGGYIFAGNTISYGTGGDSDFWLVKTDASGNEIWNRTFGGAGSDVVWSVQQTPNGEYVLAGTTNSYGFGGDAWLIKTDASGNEIWNKTFGAMRYDFASSVQQTSDGYILAGFTSSYGAGFEDAWLIKVAEVPAFNSIDSCTTITSPGDYVLSRNIVDSADPTCISITSSDVVLDGAGYTIDGIDAANTYGVHVYNSTVLKNVTVKNLIVTDWHIGIYYHNVKNSTIENNSASSNNYTGVYISSSTSNHITPSSYINLTANRVSNNSYGILILSSSNNNLTGNNANSNRYNGFSFWYSDNNILTGNNASNNSNGFYIEASGKNNLTGNNASGNSNGIILFFLSNDNILRSNIASNNSMGILFGPSGDNTFAGNNKMCVKCHGTGSSRYNTLTGNIVNSNNQYGIFINSSSMNTIYNNHFDNTNNAWDNGNNYWNITKTPGTSIAGGPYLGGNFWAHPNGTGLSQVCADNNKDSICDSKYVVSSTNIDYLPLTYPDRVPPRNITNLTNRSYAINYINWTWKDPADKDFSKVMIYINGKFRANVSKGKEYYNTTNLIPNTQYTISTHTVDTSGNINNKWVNRTARTASDSVPPASITNLRNISYASNYINWTWIDPKDIDFSRVMIYINGKFRANVLKGKRYYNTTNLLPNTQYIISTHTVDTSGNINSTWVNRTARTTRDYVPPASITNLHNISYERTYINWTWKDPSAYDFTKVMVYINGAFRTNITRGKQYFNATGLKNNTYYKISTHTVDTSGNINQTWRNHTAKTRFD